METHTFYCPKCGRELMVPFDTDAFYCTYCAAPLQMENGTLKAGLNGPEPSRPEQNPFIAIAKSGILILLSLMAAVTIPSFGLHSAFGGHIKLITMLVTGILLIPIVPFRERNRSAFFTKLTLPLSFWALEIFLADLLIRLAQFTPYR